MTAVTLSVGLNARVIGPESAPVRLRLRESFLPVPEGTPPDILAVIITTRDTDQAAESVMRAIQSQQSDLKPRAVIAVSEFIPTSELILSVVAAGADTVLHSNATSAQILVAAQSSFARAARDMDAPVTARAVELQQRVQRLTQRVIELEADAWSDPLTGLANRRQLSARIMQMFAEAVRYEGELAVILIDIDGFKLLNDTLGHRAGDEFLRSVARTISASIRSSDLAVRYGGDEFVILLPRTSSDSAKEAALRLRKALEPTFKGSTELGVAPCASLGLACLDISEPLEAEGLIDAADKAMYHAKKHGRGHVALAISDGAFEVLNPNGC